MAIPRNFLNELLARIDIINIVDQYVPLKKSGKNYSACCPFHHEKTPSFTVSSDKQFYHCFGCGAHGNAIDFIMEYQRLDFVDAVEELASSIGLEVPRENFKSTHQTKKYDDLYSLMQASSNYYQSQLRQHSDKEKAISYLKNRGINGQTAKKFALGFAPDGWSNLLIKFKPNQEQLITAGLVIKNDKNKSYDRFRHRLMFPIRDRRGRTIGFGGRVFDDSVPKYLNSPETPIFHKGKELYGLYELKQSQREIEHVIIVEGYMDVISLAQFGINYAVASLGTATTAEQIQLLFRQTKKIICCYDGDRAGKEAAWRTLETALPLLKAGLSIDFMFLPEGDDPDTYIQKHGKENFEQLLNTTNVAGITMPLPKFLFKQLNQQYRIDDGSLIKQATTMINKVNDDIYKELLFDQLALMLKMSDSAELKRKYNLSITMPSLTSQSAQKPQSRNTFVIRLTLALLVQNPSLGYQLPKQTALSLLDYRGIRLLEHLLSITHKELLTTGQLIELFREENDKKQFLMQLSQWQTDISDDATEAKFKDCLIWLTNKFIEHKIDELQQKAALNLDEKRQLQQYLKIYNIHQTSEIF